MPGALNALSGESYASVDSVIQQQSIYVREAVGARLRASVSAPGAGALGYAAQAGGPQTASLGAGLTPPCGRRAMAAGAPPSPTAMPPASPTASAAS